MLPICIDDGNVAGPHVDVGATIVTAVAAATTEGCLQHLHPTRLIPVTSIRRPPGGVKCSPESKNKQSPGFVAMRMPSLKEVHRENTNGGASIVSAPPRTPAQQELQPEERQEQPVSTEGSTTYILPAFCNSSRQQHCVSSSPDSLFTPSS
mmetsp:Transcript_34261/g.70051  ORF Transcript_34261/g.70051 Transcript_34261/m.70051 type:complete len:151 (+) Transcript_34261:1225-1677(+)